MAASRVVLDEDLRAVVDEIQRKTRTTSPSAAIALMISRYGRHLIETWELDPAQYADPNPANYYSSYSHPQLPAAPRNDFVFSEGVDL